MRRWIGASVILGVTAWWWVSSRRHESDQMVELPSGRVENSAICPWRDPAADLPRFFPGATRVDPESRILSGLRSELTTRLGRPPTGGENLLYLHRASGPDGPRGYVAARRVRGEHGGIETVIAVDGERRVVGIAIQQHREPPDVVAAIEDPAWLGRFKGIRRLEDLEEPIRALPSNARASGAAILADLRTFLILLEVSSGPGAITRAHH